MDVKTRMRVIKLMEKENANPEFFKEIGVDAQIKQIDEESGRTDNSGYTREAVKC